MTRVRIPARALNALCVYALENHASVAQLGRAPGCYRQSELIERIRL
ncbi:MAG: hypothetical protein ACFFDK_03085 [Promethearchaeota archaeon]